MIPNLFVALVMLSTVTFSPGTFSGSEKVLASHTLPLSDRYANSFVNDVFRDNILLTMAYLRGMTTTSNPDWQSVEKPFHYTVSLQPGETFAFHDDLLQKIPGKVVKTTNAHFGSQEGFKSDGYLVADGVCHMASIINWVAQDAGLTVIAPTNHDFAPIPDVPKQYGTAIYYSPDDKNGSALQNLYVENTKDKTVDLVFDYSNNSLKVSVEE